MMDRNRADLFVSPDMTCGIAFISLNKNTLLFEALPYTSERCAVYGIQRRAGDFNARVDLFIQPGE